MLQLLEDPQLVTGLHASQEDDRNPALVGSQPRAESSIGALVGSLVSRGAGLVVVLGKPSVGRQFRRDNAPKVSAGAMHGALKRRHEVRTSRGNDRDRREQAGRQAEVGRRPTEPIGVGAHRRADIVAGNGAGDEQAPRLRGRRHEVPILSNCPSHRSGRSGRGLHPPRPPAVAGRDAPAHPRRQR